MRSTAGTRYSSRGKRSDSWSMFAICILLSLTDDRARRAIEKFAREIPHEMRRYGITTYDCEFAADPNATMRGASRLLPSTHTDLRRFSRYLSLAWGLARV